MIYRCTVYRQKITGFETIDGDWRVLRAFLQRCKNDGASMVSVIRQSGDLAGIKHKVYFKKKNEPLDYEAILAHLKTLSCEERFTDSQGNTWICRDGYWNVLYAIDRPKMPPWSLIPPGTYIKPEPGWYNELMWEELEKARKRFIRDAYRLSALNDPVLPPMWKIPKPEDL